MKTARKPVETRKHPPVPALTVSIEIDPIVEVVRRHVKLSPQDRKSTRLNSSHG